MRKMENGRHTGTRGNMDYLAVYLLPAMFHVLWFVHTYSQFDLQILVGARLSHSHLMEF